MHGASQRIHTAKAFLENLGWLVIGTAVSNTISIVVTIFIIRKLPIQDFGIYSIFLGSLILFSILTINPFIVTLKRFIPELSQKKHYTFLKRFIVRTYSIALGTGIVLILTIFLIKTHVGQLMQIPLFSRYYTYFLPNLFLFFISSLNTIILTVLYRQKIVQILTIISLVLRGILYAIALRWITIEIIFFIEAVSYIAKVIPSSYFLYRTLTFVHTSVGIIPSITEMNARKKRITRFTWLSYANEMGYGALSQLSDFYLISAYMGPAAVGLYAFPYKLINAFFNWIPLIKVADIIKPIFISKYYEDNQNSENLSKMFHFLIKIYVLLFLFFVYILLAYQRLIHIYLFDSKYLHTQNLLTVILLFYLANAFSFPTGLVLEIKEKIQYNLYSKIFGIFNIAVVVFILNFSTYGLLAVAAATGVSNCLKNIYLYFCMKREIGVRLPFADMIKIFSLAFPFSIILFFIRYIDTFMILLLGPVIFGVLMIFLLYSLLSPFSSKEKEIIVKFGNQIYARFQSVFKISAIEGELTP